MTTLNRAVAVAMVQGPAAGLDVLTTLAPGKRLTSHHRLLASRARLLELAGDHAGAAVSYREAARHATSLPGRRHLASQAARLSG
jgi:predicted RNA polymerase sigma factor